MVIEMGLRIDQSRVTEAIAKELIALCPFGQIAYDGELKIGAGCRMCKACVKKGAPGVVTYEEEKKETGLNKSEWSGICVFAEQYGGKLHPVVPELLGKARELADATGQKVYALLIGSGTEEAAKTLSEYGADRVFVYDHPALEQFVIGPYANAFCDLIEKVKPSSILVGATVTGRSLAPKVAARMRSGMTADCTALEIRENTDLVQIRPAFGGNIMAQIVTPRTRPQFCTVRYKVFPAPAKGAPHGETVRMEVSGAILQSLTQVLSVTKKPEETDISDAEVLVAVGRGFCGKTDLALASELAHRLGGQLACSRPLVESGALGAKHQIGLSGRTVKPKLLIALGISGAIQFVSGMRSAELIVAVNSDPHAPIFDVAHEGFVGDAREIVPELLEKAREKQDGAV